MKTFLLKLSVVLSAGLFLMPAATIKGADKLTFTQFYFGLDEYNEDLPLQQVYAVPENIKFAYFDISNEVHLLDKEFNEVYSFKVPTQYKIEWLDNANYDTNSSGGVLVTQHIFNNDDLYEIIVKDDTGTFYIMNEKGEILAQSPINYPSYIISGGYFYLCSEYRANPIYLINGNLVEASIELLNENVSDLEISPNPVDADSIVNVQLPEFDVENVSVLVMTADGKTVYTQSNVSSSEIKIPAANLNKGVNPVVVLKGNGEIIGTGKILKK